MPEPQPENQMKMDMTLENVTKVSQDPCDQQIYPIQ